MIKKVNDYIPKIKEKFPSLSESEILKIITFGFRIYAYVNSIGGDVLIKSDSNKEVKITAFTGYLTNDSLKHYTRSLFKWRIKERILYKFKNIEWDGYYYFGMNKENHNILLDQLNNKRKKYIELDNIFSYKILNEIYHDHSVDYIYKFKYPYDIGFKIYFKKFKEKKINIEFVNINKESTWNKNQQIHLMED